MNRAFVEPLAVLAFVVVLGATAGAQEITIHENGLIYDEPTVAALQHIVDSLHARFSKH